jgi:hypothetical protein
MHNAHHVMASDYSKHLLPSSFCYLLENYTKRNSTKRTDACAALRCLRIACRTLNLASNNITGQLPGEWVSLNALQLMDVSANNITGAVPTIWQAFGGLAYQLQCLVLHSNPGLNKAFPGAPDSIVRKDFKVVTSPSATCLVS